MGCMSCWWFEGGHRQRERPSDQGQNRVGAKDDGDQLVHLPGSVSLSDVRHYSLHCSGVHPDRVLRIRHHLQVRCGLGHLPNHLCKVQQGGCFAQLKWCTEFLQRLYSIYLSSIYHDMSSPIVSMMSA